MDNFLVMWIVFVFGMIDGYVSECFEGIIVISVNKELKMLEFLKENGFDVSVEDL